MPSLQAVIDYCAKRGIPESDAKYFHDLWLGNGFTNNGGPIHNWQAVIRNRKRRGFLPSQQESKSCLYPKS
jgi:hypothetical protein